MTTEKSLPCVSAEDLDRESRADLSSCSAGREGLVLKPPWSPHGFVPLGLGSPTCPQPSVTLSQSQRFLLWLFPLWHCCFQWLSFPESPGITEPLSLEKPSETIKSSCPQPCQGHPAPVPQCHIHRAFGSSRNWDSTTALGSLSGLDHLWISDQNRP